MKKSLTLTAILIIFICMIGLFTKERLLIRDRNITLENSLLSIPKVKLYDTYNKEIILDNICEKRKTIIVFFDTDCDICHIEAREFIRLHNNFKDSQIIFISSNSIGEIKEFITDNKLEHSGFIFLNDKYNELSRSYDIPTTPFMLLYIDNKLYNSYKGGINIEQIVKDKYDK